MSRLPRLARCVAFSLLAAPLATSAFAASPSMPSTTSATMPAQKTSGPSSAPVTRNTLTVGPQLSINPNLTGRLPFSATRNILSAKPDWLRNHPAAPSSAGPSTVTTPGVTVAPGNVKLPGMSVEPGKVTTPSMSVGPGKITTSPQSVGRGGLTTDAPVIGVNGVTMPRSTFRRLPVQPETIDPREDLELFFGGH